MIRYLILGIIGMAIALTGIVMVNYLVAALGGALIFGAFFWFVRSNQGTPAPAQPDDSVRQP